MIFGNETYLVGEVMSAFNLALHERLLWLSLPWPHWWDGHCAL